MLKRVTRQAVTRNFIGLDCFARFRRDQGVVWIQFSRLSSVILHHYLSKTEKGDTLREMEAADWASLSDQELLEHRISTLGLQLEGRHSNL